MADIAQLGLEVRSDSVVTANDRLRDFDGQAERTNRAADAMRKTIIRAAAAFAAFIGAAASIRQFITNTVEAERAQAQLAAAIQSTGGAAGRTLAQLNENAAALQSMTIYGDEAINALQGVLLTFTRIRGDEFDQATYAVLDMATALKMDLQSAAIQVGKALNDPILGVTALGRAGVQFTESQKEMIKSLVETGQTAEAQRVILAELNTQFEGSAEAARNTLGGALTALGNAWGDLFEVAGPASERLRQSIEGLILLITSDGFVGGVQAIGAWFFGAMSTAIGAIGSIINVIDQFSDHILVAVAALSGFFAPVIIAGLGAVTFAIGTGMVGAVRALTAAMLANPLGLLIAGIAAAVTAAYLFRDQIKQVLGVDVVEVAKGAGNAIVGAFDLAFRNIQSIWGAMPGVIGDIAIGTANNVIAAIEGMVNGAIGLLNGLVDMANNIPGVDIGRMGDVSFGELDNPHSGATGQLDLQMALNKHIVDGTDYIGEWTAALGEAWATAEGATDQLNALSDAIGGGEGLGGEGGGGGINEALEAANDNLLQLQDSLMHVLATPADPFVTLQNEIAGLNQLLAAGVISWDQYAAAVQRATAGAASDTLTSVSQITGILAGAFEDNKALAIANTVISTAAGVMKAFEQGGMFAFPMAAAIAAAGVAQIGTIMSAKPGGGSGGVRAPGASAPASAAPQQQAQRETVINLTLGGNGRYSRDDVRDLLEQMTSELDDGVGTKFKLAVNQ